MDPMSAMSAIGLAGNIVQFIEFGGQVVRRLHEFSSNARDVPQTFREVTNSLPLLLDSLENIRRDLNNGEVDPRTEAALLPVIQDCTEKIESLNQILEGILPAPGDSQWETLKKALTSFWQDKKIQRNMATITNYQGPILLYQTRQSSQRLSIPQTIGQGGPGDNSFSDRGTMVLFNDRTRERLTPYSPDMTPISTTSSLGSPTETILESGWSIRTESTARTVWTSPDPVASEPQPCQSEPANVEAPFGDPPLMLSEPAIDPLQRKIEAKM